MNSGTDTKAHRALTERLAAGGLRFTPQRRQVYDVLLQQRDHPTAEDVFLRARHDTPDIAMATVYNCLDALVKCGLARLVVLDRGATRYCSNMEDHCHYYCAECGMVFDAPLPADASLSLPRPKGFKIDHYEIAVHGVCSECGSKHRKSENLK